jgi:hypothetical protein
MESKTIYISIEEKNAFEEAKNILKSLIEEQKKMDNKILDIEKEFSMEIEDVNIQRKIDRINKDKDDFIVWIKRLLKQFQAKTN